MGYLEQRLRAILKYFGQWEDILDKDCGLFGAKTAVYFDVFWTMGRYLRQKLQVIRSKDCGLLKCSGQWEDILDKDCRPFGAKIAGYFEVFGQWEDILDKDCRPFGTNLQILSCNFQSLFKIAYDRHRQPATFFHLACSLHPQELQPLYPPPPMSRYLWQRLRATLKYFGQWEDILDKDFGLFWSILDNQKISYAKIAGHLG